MTAADLDRLAERLGAGLRAGVGREVPLGPFTTYRVGGPAAIFVEVEDHADLAVLADVLSAEPSPVPTLVVGKGSNLLVADAGFPGVALRLGAGFAAVEIDRTEVVVGGAVALPVLARQTAGAGLTGLEWAVGVPGSVGGGVRMNAGGHGSDIAATLVEVHLRDLRTGEDGVVSVGDLALGYRRSSVRPTQVVVSARFRLTEGDRDVAMAEIAEIVAWRRDNQPGGPNAGSVFTNPDGDAAGRLIDAAGGKGLRHGTAEVSPKHANFIQADPGGRADDVHALMGEVRALVRAHSGVDLQAETRLIGFAEGEPAS
jgi:UDP-N-acetylmuramate dehydrogenase